MDILRYLESTQAYADAGERLKQRRAAVKRRRKRTAVAVFIVSVFLVSYFGPGVYASLNETVTHPQCSTLVSQLPTPPDKKRIALIDELSTDSPDPAFIQSVNASAQAEGYGLDYYPPGSVTLNFFRTLPSRGYSIVIFRNHGPGVGVSDVPGIATSESYSDYSWVWDQLNNNLATITIGNHEYFAITPKFVSDLMCGQFSGTIVMAMFCDSANFFVPILHSFINKGASSFVGWNSTVSAQYDDLVFAKLMPLVLAGYGVGRSVAMVMADTGPDPEYGGTLSYYPH